MIQRDRYKSAVTPPCPADSDAQGDWAESTLVGPRPSAGLVVRPMIVTRVLGTGFWYATHRGRVTASLSILVGGLLLASCASTPPPAHEEKLQLEAGPSQPLSTERAPTGTQAPAQSGAMPVISAEENEYRIGPEDLIKIEVFQVEELSSTERVNLDGTVTLPLIGKVVVGGLTAIESEALIADRLRENFLQDPQVNVHIEEYSSQRVTVTGAVKNPGVYALTGPVTLVQAIAMAEGSTAIADTHEVLVFRAGDDGNPIIYLVNLDEIQRGEKPDPMVQRDDRIVVPQSGSKTFIKGLTDTLRGFIRLY